MARLRGSIGPERMPMQMHHIEHGAKIDAAANDGVSRGQSFNQSLGRKGQERCYIVRLKPKLCHKCAGSLPCIAGALSRHLLAAHGGCAVKQAVCSRHGHQRGNLCTAARLPENHHLGRVAAKIGDVIAHPFQGANEVQLAKIATITKTRAKRRQPAIAEYVETMIDGHNHHVLLSGKMWAMRQRIGDRTCIVSPAMKIDHDWPRHPPVGVRRPDIEKEAILADGVGYRAALRAKRAEPISFLLLLRQFLADRRFKTPGSCIAYAKKGRRSAIDYSAPCQHLRVTLAGGQWRSRHSCSGYRSCKDRTPRQAISG